MRIGIQTWGSDGDIRPFVALARGLRAAGHDLSLVITSIDNTDYSALGAAMDVEVEHVYRTFRLEQTTAIVAKILRANRTRQFELLFEHLLEPAIEAMYDASERLCGNNDLVIGHSLVHTLHTAAEKRDCPRIAVTLCPATLPSRFVTPPGSVSLGNWLNPFWWRLGDHLFSKRFCGSLHKQREREGLPRLKSLFTQVWQSDLLTIIASSPTLCERQPDWADPIAFSGFLNLPESAEPWNLPDGLREFLDRGDPPVFLTFGSFTQFDPTGALTVFREAVRLAGCRAIVQADWEGLTDCPTDPNIYRIGTAPHSHVFPHCAAVVHHGGAGTVQSSLRSGCPSVVVVHAFDQAFWGKRLHQLGAAPKPLSRRTLTPAKLARRIRQVLDDPELAQQAKRLGATISKEDGVRRAVELIAQ